MPSLPGSIQPAHHCRCATGYEAARAVPALAEPPGAISRHISCHADLLAAGSMRAVLDAGSKVPGDACGFGIDDTEEGQFEHRQAFPPGTPLTSVLVIVWINGVQGVGKTTTSALVQPLIPDSGVFDAEDVGETLVDIGPGLPATDDFQPWPPWRPLVVETARRVLERTGGPHVAAPRGRGRRRAPAVRHGAGPAGRRSWKTAAAASAAVARSGT
ncbi:hypothetical protein MO973_15080 [Paenibacillus sp. TRM 82003]|nr:hypothetical protein [Kineococcus sp. TRM81007]MCI2238585.1 hypothetical protein [Kineococcus sp. TRM81007]MCI3921556.1 hypothetical protein [Paenibacillus sp. TRM 82003]